MSYLKLGYKHIIIKMNIKKIKTALFIIIFSLFVNISYSQIIGGFHGGLNIASLSGEKNYDDNTSRLGLNAYAFIEIPFNYIVSLETGLGYASKGMNHKSLLADTGATNILRVKNKLNYLIVPVYLKENFTNFYTKIGPYGAYLLSAKSLWKNVEERAGVLQTTTGEYEDFQDDLLMYDVGVSIGLGYIHFFNKKRRGRKRRGRRGRRKTTVMQIDLKYDIGFMSLDKTGRNDNLKLKNRTLTFGVSFTSVLD